MQTLASAFAHTLTEVSSGSGVFSSFAVVSVSFFSINFKYVFVCWSNFRKNYLEEFGEITPLKCSAIFK